jgi:hypothetical protein
MSATCKSATEFFAASDSRFCLARSLTHRYQSMTRKEFMAWHNFKLGSLVFSPKVTPDPGEAERLADKFARASQNQSKKVPPQLRVVVRGSERQK